MGGAMNSPSAKWARRIAFLVLLMATGCGAPASYGAGAVPNPISSPPTSLPIATSTTVAMMASASAVPNLLPTTSLTHLPSGTPSAMVMPGMDAPPTTAPVTVVTHSPDATQFVLDDVLYGTPSVTAAPLNVSALVTPTLRVGKWHATTVGSTQPVTAVTAAPPDSAALNPVAPTITAKPPSPTVPGTAVSGAAVSGAGVGNVANGKVLFSGTGGCNACHDVTNGVTIVGPSLKGIASRAETRKPGMSAADYLYESIVKPNTYVVPGFTPGVMLQTFGQTLSQTQINDLVAYLLTLK